MRPGWEWRWLVREIKLHRDRLTARLIRNIRTEGECAVWTGASTGSRRGTGYPSMNVRYLGKHRQIRVHRLFVMLQERRPIPPKYEAGHFHCHNPLCVRHVESQLATFNHREPHFRGKETAASAEL